MEEDSQGHGIGEDTATPGVGSGAVAEGGEESGPITTTSELTAITLPVEGVEGLIPLCVQHLKGPHQTTATFGYDIARMEHRPWAQPSAKKSDYFNYGFDEQSWRLYCALQVEGQESLVRRAREVLHALQVGATMSPMMLHASPGTTTTTGGGGGLGPTTDSEGGGGGSGYYPIPGPPSAYHPAGGMPFAFSSLPPHGGTGGGSFPSLPPGGAEDGPGGAMGGGPSGVGEGNPSHLGYVSSHGMQAGRALGPSGEHLSSTDANGGGEGGRGGGGRPPWMGSTGSSAGHSTNTNSSSSSGGGGYNHHRFYKTQVCKDFLEGRCFRGAACNYAHGEEELRTMPTGVLPGHTPSSASPMGGGPAPGVGMVGTGHGGGGPLRAMKRPRPEYSLNTKGRR